MTDIGGRIASRLHYIVEQYFPRDRHAAVAWALSPGGFVRDASVDMPIDRAIREAILDEVSRLRDELLNLTPDRYLGEDAYEDAYETICDILPRVDSSGAELDEKVSRLHNQIVQHVDYLHGVDDRGPTTSPPPANVVSILRALERTK